MGIPRDYTHISRECKVAWHIQHFGNGKVVTEHEERDALLHILSGKVGREVRTELTCEAYLIIDSL